MSLPEPTPNLQLRDRIDYPYILSRRLLNLDQVMLKPDAKPNEVKDAIELLRASVPTRYQDDDYEKELAGAEETKTVDIRPKRGHFRLSNEFCIQHALPITRTEKTVNHFKVLAAIMNLLQRRGMLTKPMWLEKIVGEITDDDVIVMAE